MDLYTLLQVHVENIIKKGFGALMKNNNFVKKLIFDIKFLLFVF